MKDEKDKYFYDLCTSVAQKSKCHTKKVGSVLALDDITVCTGVNGPAKGLPECSERLIHDEILLEILKNYGINESKIKSSIITKKCPREVMGFVGQQGLEYCNAIHAELNCLLSATRMGVPTNGGTLYSSNDEAPCAQCFSACIQAGIVEIVVVKAVMIDSTIQWCMDNSDILVREFNI